MIDQVKALKAKGVACALLSSLNKETDNKSILKVLEDLGKSGLVLSGNTTKINPLKLLYCTPEMIDTIRFQGILRSLYLKNKISMFAIDEAHCLSCWGHTFRPAYLKLSWLRREFPDVACMACTATATKKVIEDIRKCLCFDSSTKCLVSSFNRRNISYEVRYKDHLNHTEPKGALGNLVAFVKSQHASRAAPCAGIIYVHKRTDASYIAQKISKQSGVKATAYHAGLKDTERSLAQDLWMKGDVQIVVATVAFGMGIDLGHVRYVIHWCLSKTVEGFYQESGRAGRDGLPSKSILYFSNEDASKLSFIMRKNCDSKTFNQKTSDRSLDALESMIKYCTLCSCRRQYLLKHFDEEIDKDTCNNTCDFCLSPTKVKSALKMSKVLPNRISLFKPYIEKAEQSWDGQLNGPDGDYSDCDFEFTDNKNENGLSIYGTPSSLDIHEKNASTKIEKKASSSKGRLSEKFSKKYEVCGILLENLLLYTLILQNFIEIKAQDLGGNGFVTFKAKNTKRAITPIIPNHLKKGLPDPYAMATKSSNSIEENNKSSSINSQIAALQKKINALKQKR